MIASLYGQCVEQTPPHLVLSVQGVGYEIEMPDPVFHGPTLSVGEDVLIYTHQVIREDAHALYGFLDRAQRDWFRHLLKVSGIGPKLALKILSHLELMSFVRAVRDKDVARLTRVSGLGKKTAERLCIDMEQTVKAYALRVDQLLPEADSALHQAIQALVVLGYTPVVAEKMVRGLKDSASLPTEELVRAALKQVKQHAR